MALGDSGGPLVIDGKLAGVVSGGSSSDYGHDPARFAKISTYSAELHRQIFTPSHSPGTSTGAGHHRPAA